MTLHHLPRLRHPGTLGQVATRDASMLTLAREQCEGEGRLSVARLIEQQGERAALADIADELTADCPRRGSRQCPA